MFFSFKQLNYQEIVVVVVVFVKGVVLEGRAEGREEPERGMMCIILRKSGIKSINISAGGFCSSHLQSQIPQLTVLLIECCTLQSYRGT
jgi:hypothetical protein